MSAAIGVVDRNHKHLLLFISVRTNALFILSMAQLSLPAHKADNALNFAFVQLNAPFRISLEAQYTSIHIERDMLWRGHEG